MENQKMAKLGLKLLAKQIELSQTKQIREMDWDTAITLQVTGAKNISYWLERNKLKTMKVWDILEDKYQYALAEALSLLPQLREEDSVTGELWLLLQKLPSNLPTKLWLSDMDLDPLLRGVWYLFEDHDMNLDLGDDGMDEMEMAMSNVAYLLDATRNQAFIREKNLFDHPIYAIQTWIIKELLLDDCEVPHISSLNINEAQAILELLSKENTHMEATEWLLDYIIKEIG